MGNAGFETVGHLAAWHHSRCARRKQVTSASKMCGDLSHIDAPCGAKADTCMHGGLGRSVRRPRIAVGIAMDGGGVVVWKRLLPKKGRHFDPRNAAAVVDEAFDHARRHPEFAKDFGIERHQGKTSVETKFKFIECVPEQRNSCR